MQFLLYDLGFLYDLGLILIVSTFLAYFSRALKQPMLVAYFLAGVIIGPFGLGFIQATEVINTLAQVGIAFLLFTVGLELDFKKLRSVGYTSLLGAGIQVVLSFLLGFGLGTGFGFSPLVSVYTGLLFAFSSTMIVAKLLVDRSEVETLHGRTMLAILVIQDLIIIVTLPFLSNLEAIFSMEILGRILINALGLFSFAVVLNRFVFKRLLKYAARSKELLFFTSVSICFLFIGLARTLHFSIAIGAFIAGISMANFPYNMEIETEVRSLRDFFSILFFATLGMQFNPSVIQHLFWPFIISLLLIIVAKPVILALTYLFLGYGGRESSIVGLGMGQSSEFAFIMAAQGVALGHLSTDLYSFLVSLVVISMLTTPYLMRVRNQLYELFSGIKIFDLHKRFESHYLETIEREPEERLKDHIVVIGGGVGGKRIINYLLTKKKDFVVIDSNPEVVEDLSEQEIHCIYGDASHEEILQRAGVFRAKMVALSIPDVPSSVYVTKKIKGYNSKIKVFARAHTRADADDLHQAGADYIVIPELASGDEIIRLMGEYL